MATDFERLTVQLQANISQFEKQMQRATRTMNQQSRAIENRWKQTNKTLASSVKLPSLGGGVGGLAAGVFGGVSVDTVRRMADAWTEAGNRIKAAEAITGRSARSLDALNKIANETRTGISETAELYAKLLTATKDVAQSEEEVARATELVNKAFKAGGASASEQAAGILQLSQALGSGVLQGDELRSLRENAPLIAKAIADEFKTTVAGLKELGAEGKLTSDRVFKAILNGANEINTAFASTDATIGDTFTRLTNTLTRLVGILDKAGGFTSEFATKIDNLDKALAEFEKNPGVRTLINLLGGEVIEDGLLDKALRFFEDMSESSGRSSKEIEKDIAVVEADLADLQRKAAEGFSVRFSIEKAQSELGVLKTELANVGIVAEGVTNQLQRLADSAEQAFSAVVTPSFREAENASMKELGKTDKFRADRDAEIRKSEYEKELAQRTKEVMEAAEKAGVALTEAAAKIQAASEIAVENAKKTSEASTSSAVELIKQFEGFRSTPYWDVNAMRAGFGSDTVTLDDGSVQRITRGMSVTLEQANRDLARRIDEFQNVIERQIGSSTFRAMSENQQAALTSIAYNYGSLPERIVEAIKTGNVETISNAIRGLGGDNGGVNAGRRNKEADIFESGAPELVREDIELRRQRDDIIRQTIETIRQQNAAIGEETALLGTSNAEKERARLVTETLNELQRQGIEITDEIRAQVEAEAGARYEQVAAYDAAVAKTEELAMAQEELARIQEEVGSAFSGALKGFISDLANGKSLTEALTNAVGRLADRLLDIALDNLFDSLSSPGGGGGDGLGGILKSIFSLFGFSRGGYTGDGGKYQPAGLVHRGEFVSDQQATKKYRPLLEAMNRGRLPGFASGGFVGNDDSYRLPAMFSGGRSAAGSRQLGRVAPNVQITVYAQDAQSFMESRNQIAARTANALRPSLRTT